MSIRQLTHRLNMLKHRRDVPVLIHTIIDDDAERTELSHVIGAHHHWRTNRSDPEGIGPAVLRAHSAFINIIFEPLPKTPVNKPK